MYKTVKFMRWDCHVIKRQYGNGRTALVLEDSYDGEPIATCTINLPDEDLADNEVIIKDYSENQGMLDTLISAGIISHPKRHVQSGYIVAPVCDLLHYEA
jgi:hypothetical protein